MDLLKALKNIQFVEPSKLKPNNYNPNVVCERELGLLVQSILTNGWTMPIVVRPDFTIIDGFHRWTVAQKEPLKSKLGGVVPVVIVEHATKEEDMYGTITHNRARGVHLLEPMKAIVKELLEKDIPVDEICKQLGMEKEEVFRLAGLTREQFLDIVKGKTYTEVQLLIK